ncbi:MAG TPA: hypothetical protein PLD23_20825 [Armatimonadota bacterium]|nr:hypothetical protein [Armatimonadota bacterium]
MLFGRVSFVVLLAVAVASASMCSAQVVVPTVVSVTSKVFTPTTGTYQPSQLITGATEHKAVFDTSQANYLPCRLRLTFSQYPSWNQSGAYGTTQDCYTYTRNAAVPMYAQPNPRLHSWTVPDPGGPAQYAFVATTSALPAACSQQYGPPPPPPPPDEQKAYTSGEWVQGGSDATQINVP